MHDHDKQLWSIVQTVWIQSSDYLSLLGTDTIEYLCSTGRAYANNARHWELGEKVRIPGRILALTTTEYINIEYLITHSILNGPALQGKY